MNDQKVIELLKKGRQSKAFLKLYKNYPHVEKLILSKGGSKEDAKDVFQDALVIFYEKVMNTDFTLTSSISTYLYSVSRFIWKDRLKKENRKPEIRLSMTFSSEQEAELDEVLQKEEQYKTLEKLLTQIGDKCLELLKLFYFKGLKMKDIAPIVGLKSEKIARNQKYKCLEKAKEKVKSL